MMALFVIADDGSADILPVSNTLQFVTSATQQSFVLSVLPDSFPELDEVSIKFS